MKNYSKRLRKRMYQRYRTMPMTPFLMPTRRARSSSEEVGLSKGENFKLKKHRPCPFCEENRKYKYVYYFGLLRHVIREHCYNASHQPTGYLEKDRVRYIRRWIISYSKYEDLRVKNYKHVEYLIYHYCLNEWNPSMRGLS